MESDGEKTGEMAGHRPNPSSVVAVTRKAAAAKGAGETPEREDQPDPGTSGGEAGDVPRPSETAPAPSAGGAAAGTAVPGGNGEPALDGQRRTLEMDPNLVTLFKQKTVEAEQFRMLKTKILFPEKGTPPRSIMVTSAVPGEGKTFVACNLAISIAQSLDEYVLLMDCDMRLPNIHTRFGFEGTPGLSEYLTGQHPLSSLLLKTDVDKLTILPGGEPPDNPSELLSSGQMAGLFEEVKGRYSDRYIIVDSPPPQLTAESRALAMRVDGIVLVVKRGAAPREQVRELLDLLGRDKIIGVVFNYSNAEAMGGYRYGHYGTYGNYYGKPQA